MQNKTTSIVGLCDYKRADIRAMVSTLLISRHDDNYLIHADKHTHARLSDATRYDHAARPAVSGAPAAFWGTRRCSVCRYTHVHSFSVCTPHRHTHTHTATFLREKLLFVFSLIACRVILQGADLRVRRSRRRFVFFR